MKLPEVSTSDSWIFSLLGEKQFQRQRGFLLWWYRMTAPPEPDEHPTLTQRDVARRSKILSALALFLALLLLFVAVIGLTGPNKQILGTVEILYPTLAVCLLLNRRGHINLAGMLLTLALLGGMYFTLFTTAFFHGGLAANDKDILYLPVMGDLVAAALLPPATIFCIATFNTSLSLWMLYQAPHTADFAAMMAGGASSITFRIVELHFFVSLVAWIMVSWTLISVKQADRATELARLEHDLHTEAQEKLRQKAQVERSIEEIVRVHMEIANGNLEARAPLRQENVLWQVAVPLNNLLGRYQQAARAAQERDAYQRILTRLVEVHPQIRAHATQYLHNLQNARSSQWGYPPPVSPVSGPLTPGFPGIAASVNTDPTLKG